MVDTKQSLMQKISTILKKIGIDPFLILLIGMILLAYLVPQWGNATGPFSLKNIANYGISVIFFFYGLRLSPEKFKAGLTNWRLHIVIHFATFILFPLLILPLKPLFTNESSKLLWLGLFYMAALPSTVSSSVVMVSLANGNIPAAIFNASISSLLGVFITPLWMSIVLSGDIHTPDLYDIIIKLIIQIVLPIVLGIFLNKYWGAFANKHKKLLSRFDQTIILIIIYTSFCNSFSLGIFDEFGIAYIIYGCIGTIILFGVVYGTIHLLSLLFKFNREDRITALFCGSKKSLVHGTVMSKVLFPNYASIGILLLPIMMYHTIQLMIISIIAQKFKKA